MGVVGESWVKLGVVVVMDVYFNPFSMKYFVCLFKVGNFDLHSGASADLSSSTFF